MWDLFILLSVIEVHVFSLLVVCHWINMPQFIYLIFCWRAFGTSPEWGSYEKLCYYDSFTSLLVHICVLLGTCLAVELMGHWRFIYSTSVDTSFPKWLDYFMLPPSEYKSSNYSPSGLGKMSFVVYWGTVKQFWWWLPEK